jgi:hypothetical protein
MRKRALIIGDYDTAAHGWTLSSFQLSAAEQKTNYIEKSGGDGSWDMSTVMTDGIPRYRNRDLTATLECSVGTRADREALISELVNKLDGWEWHIVTPDRPEHYLIGRVHVAVDYNDPAHASVTITAHCEPWLNSAEDIVVTLVATATEQSKIVHNAGRKAVIPRLEVSGTVKLTFGTSSIQMTEGIYEWPGLFLTPGDHVVKYSGNGRAVLVYREAVLR